MRQVRRCAAVVGILSAAIPTGFVLARSIAVQVAAPPTFELSGRPIAIRPGVGGRPAPTAAYLTGGRIAAIGENALVIDADSGKLILARTTRGGQALATLSIGHDAGLLAFDDVAKLAYVADRLGDKVAVVAVGPDRLELARTIATPAEPFGIALSPDRKMVLVSTIADRTLVAYEAASGKELWRTALGREPRGLAISPDGKRALVAYLATGTVDQIDLASHRAEHVALSTSNGARRPRRFGAEEGPAFARAAFAVTFMGASQAVVPFQREVPVQIQGQVARSGSYGGGFEPPITHQMAFLGFTRDTPAQVTAAISQHQPRALAWDRAHDALYVAGLGSDSILQVRDAAHVSIAAGINQSVTSGGQRCGPDGLAITPRGDVLVWCSFARSVRRLEVVDGEGALATTAVVVPGAELVASRLTPAQHAGMIAFHAADAAVSERGSMACSSCHPDGRADGLSWRIDTHVLQTPLLGGRLVGTHPYKWDGQDKDLRTSLTATMRRLGGFGLDKDRTDALQAYVEQLPNVRAPTRDATSVARGRQLFDSAELGCRTCHDGKTYADNQQHAFGGTLAESDTPSLLGLAASAPYYHDGSAPTLEALLRDRAAVHGMADGMTKLSDRQVTDLVAFLETL